MIRDAEARALLAGPIINVERFREAAWAGLPNRQRAVIWRLFLGYQPVKIAQAEVTLGHKRRKYLECADGLFTEEQRRLWTNAYCATEKQIMRDLPRTPFPLMKNMRVQHIFLRILFTWAARHPACGYVQGMHECLVPLFVAFVLPYTASDDPGMLCESAAIDELGEEVLREVEADVFGAFQRLLDGIQTFYTPSQPAVWDVLESVGVVLRRTGSGQVLDAKGVAVRDYAFRWLCCLFVHEFSPNVALLFRVWDVLLAEYAQIPAKLVWLSVAFVEKVVCGVVLGELDRADIVLRLQNTGASAWSIRDIDEFLALAFVYGTQFEGTIQHLR